MEEKIREIVLAARSSRNRVTRCGDGTIYLSWGALSLRMSQEEFAELAAILEEARRCRIRRGQLARGYYGQAVRCPMGQVMLSHGRLTLWFSPEEFEQCCGLVVEARSRLADAEPLPALGKPWHGDVSGFFGLN